ncbi:MAG: DUF3341 domain-containing protein [Gemmatimonadota bacterium]
MSDTRKNEGRQGVLASFDYLDSAVDSVKSLRKAGYRDITTYGPLPEHHLEEALGYGPSPVRVFTLVGALTGAAAGLGFTMFTSLDWPLITGGKPVLSIPAYVPIIFEMMVLFGVLATIIGLLVHMKLPHLRPLVVYDPDFSGGRFGVYVSAPGNEIDKVREILHANEPAEIREDPEGEANA